MTEMQQVYTAVPLHETNQLEEPRVDLENGFVYDDEDQESCALSSESFASKWWRTIVTFMTCINSAALYLILQDVIYSEGLFLPSETHTVVVLISLYYIINCPGMMVIYFDYWCKYFVYDDYTVGEYASMEDDEKEGCQEKVFRSLVGCICVLQNYFFWQLVMHIYGVNE